MFCLDVKRMGRYWTKVQEVRAIGILSKAGGLNISEYLQSRYSLRTEIAVRIVVMSRPMTL